MELGWETPRALAAMVRLQPLHLRGKGTKGDEMAGALGDRPWWDMSWTVLAKTKFGDYLRFRLARISVPQPCSFSYPGSCYFLERQLGLDRVRTHLAQQLPSSCPRCALEIPLQKNYIYPRIYRTLEFTKCSYSYLVIIPHLRYYLFSLGLTFLMGKIKCVFPPRCPLKFLPAPIPGNVLWIPVALQVVTQQILTPQDFWDQTSF